MLIIGITVLLGVYSAICTYNVFGENLLYVNSEWGYIFAVTYRWSYILFIVMLLATIMVLHRNKTDRSCKVNDHGITSKIPKNTLENKCPKCGETVASGYRFCSKCGNEIKVVNISQ
tara:strand:- start:137 stop:487 length:351 start_codon:yes stop_codon:yes gene_type:complete